MRRRNRANGRTVNLHDGYMRLSSPQSERLIMDDISGLLWALINIVGPLLLAGVLAYGGYQTIKRRQRTGTTLDARRATPAEAAAAGGDRRSSNTDLMRLGIPVAAAVVLIAVVVALYL
jgi:hypothetical protein